MSGEASFRFTPRLVVGLAVMALGLLFLLDNMQIIAAKEYIRYWPVVLIVIGAVKLLGRGDVPARAAGIFWILAGGLFLFSNLDLLHLRFRDVLPGLLLLGGGFMVWRTIIGRRFFSAATDVSATLSTLAIMSGVERKVASQNFRGGEATAIMGGCEIDLRGASISETPAVIDVFAWWGGIELIVPEDWTVVGKVLPLMGGFEDSTKPPAAGPRKELVVKGFAIMGGVEVRNK